MAEKTKTIKKITKPTDTLKQENEEKVDVKILLKDERTSKILGSVCLLLSIFFFIAFSSYLFTWEDDQDKVFNEGFNLLIGSNSKLSNLMGSFGAIIAHLLIYKGFGIASFLICTLFFILGINLFFGQKVFSVSKNIKYLIVGLPLISITAAIIMQGNSFAWGGAVGDMCRNFLYATIGKIGAIGLVAVGFLAYIIWRFNPTFNLPFQKTAHVNSTDTLINENANHNFNDNDLVVEPQNTTDKPGITGNTLTENTGMSGIQDLAPTFNHQLVINERAEVEDKQNLAQHEAFIKPLSTTNITADKLINDNKIEAEDSFVTIQAPKKQLTAFADLTLELKTEPEIIEAELLTQKAAADVNKQSPYDPILDLRDYKYPSVDLLESHGSEKIVQDPQELENNKNQIISTLKNYDIEIQRISATVGPTVTLYEIIPAPGVRISRIKNLEDDIALSLAALGIRIIAPIPGKGTIGIEVPNTRKTMVSMRTLLDDDKFTKSTFSLPIAIGKKIDNTHFVVDLAAMPHLLMAGATGQGKSVGLNAILVSLLYKKHPSQLKFVLVDPKKVELSIYKVIEKHFLAKLPGEEDSIITDTKKVVHTLNALCIEMDNRYDLLKEAGCRNIREYNEKFVSRKLNPEKGHQFLPFIVLVVDEFADLIMTAGKEVEMPIARLAQLARAIGIHLIIATQRPSVNIITGTIKANFPARIAFKVSSKIDSRTILDTGGAEQLIGKGDMLISYNGELVRLQCAFVDTPEVDKVCDYIGSQRGYPEAFLLPEYEDDKEKDAKDFDVNNKDALFDDAAKLIVMSQSGSTSLLQRKMKLGYNRAGRLMDQLEAAGIVGPNQGSKVRDVLVKTEADLNLYLNDL